MKETIIQNTIAIEKALEEICKEYNLEKNDVYDLFSKVYKENMQFKGDL